MHPQGGCATAFAPSWPLAAHSTADCIIWAPPPRPSHCTPTLECTCKICISGKFNVARNPLLLFGRLLLERQGASADLQGEVGFCRSTHDFFTSCSSTQITTSLWRSSRCRRRHIVDKSSPPAAFVVRWIPRTEFRPGERHFCVPHPCTRLTRNLFTPAPHPHRHPSSSGPHTSAAPALLLGAVGAAACTEPHRRPHAARRPFGRRWSSRTF